MKRTMQFSVGGQTVDVPADEIGQFSEAAKMTGASPTPMRRFRIGGQEIDVPEGELDQFVEAAKVTGSSPEEVRTFQMADGSSRSFTGAESAAFLRSPEYRSSADYVPPEQGSPTWASIKGAASGAAEGAWEGGKAGLAKAAWALPQVGTGVLRAAGNVANLGGNAKNAVGDALVGVADAADAKMEEVFPTSTAARLGYEDWGTKTGDFFGNVAGMAVKFAPAMGAGVASRGATIFAESMFASDGINAYARTFDQAKENGADDVSANALGAMSGLVNYFGGKALLKAGGVGAKIQNPILRELAAAGMSGGVMGAQGGANQAIENVATGKPVGEGVAGAVAEGVAEGAAFHGANMIPRLPKFVKQTKEHFTAARNWIMDAAKDDPQILSELMDQPAMDAVIKARRNGADVSRRMGDDVFLPNNMSGEQRNAVIDSIIAYRDGLKAREELAKANRAAEAEAGRAADEEALTRKFKDSAERQNARQNAEALKMAREGAEETASEQPTNVNAGRGENAELLQQSADQYATMDADGKAAYSAWRKANGKADTEANRLDWFQNEYVAKRSRLSERATENEIPELTREEYEAQLKEWEARKAVAQKQGKKFDEPKPVAPKQMEFDFKDESKVSDEPKPVAKTQTSADDGFRAWAVGRDGKPMEFATPADEARSREVYEMLVKSGKVDPETGRTIVPTAPEVSEKAPEQAPVAEPAQKTEVKRIENPKAGGRKTAKKAEEKAENAGVVAAQKILKEKFYQDEKTLAKALAALPEQAPKELRGAYETAIAEAKRRAGEKSAETPASDDSAKTPSDVSSPKGNAFRVGNGITAEVSKAGDGKFVVELNEKDGGAYPNARFDTEAQAADYARKCGELVDSGKFNLISAIMEVDKSLPDEFIPNRARLTAAKPDGKGRMVKAKREQKKLEAISKKMNESAKIFNAEFKKFAEDFGLEEFDKKVNRRDYGHVGEFDETAALDHMRKFDIDTLRDLKTRAVKFNLGHYNGRDEKIKEWFDKVIAEKESAKKAPQTPSAASATKKAEPAAPTAAKPAQPVQPPKAETPAEFKARISDDPVLKRIDAEFRKAKTDAERNALQERFRARVEELRSLADADRLESMRSDSKVIAWAERNGLGEVVDGKVSPRAVVDYLRNQVEMAKRATKRLFADANVEVKDRDWNAEIDGNDGLLKDKSGRVVGIFDPATKKVTLYRGADAKTVYHELIGHGVEDWARRNDKALHGKLMDLAKTAPKEIVDDVRSRYPDADEATIAKEVIARIAEGKGLENIRLREAPKAWYAKAYVAVRDAILGFMEKIGLNRVDLSKIESMTPAEAMDHLMKEVAGGKTLGEIGASGADAKVGRLEKWANAFYDRHTSLAKLSKDAAEAKSLQPGREAAFEALVFKPKKDAFAEILKRNDITAYEVDEYMKAVAAPERNAADGFESSGMSDELAARTRKHYEGSSRFDGIKEAADFLWKMQEEGMLERIRAGLVGKDEYAEWKAREKHHVPFRSAVDENGDHIPWTRGVSGPEFIQHEGRYSESGSPSAWMFQEFANAHLRAIENDSRLVLKNAVESDPSIGRIETNPEIREQRSKGGEGSPNVVSYKTVGKDGRAVTHHIVLEGERGSAAASSYTNRDLMNKSPLLKKTQAFMRFWASTATEWSPTFALRNTFADNIDLASVVLVEKGAKEGRRWIADYAKNRSGLRREMWKFAREGKVDSGSVLERFIRNGGLIGGFQREGYADLNEQFGPKRIARDFAAGRNRANAVRRYTLDLVKAVNSYAELMTRVAAFKTNVDAGMDAKDAALWSRRISVDFNRKGNVTPITNTLFMFSNSTIGATMRQIEAMGKGWKTPEGRRALAGLAAFGVAEAAIEHFFNQSVDEENERKGDATGKDVNEHTRKTSLYFRYGNRVFRAPVHEDPLMKLVYVANATTRYALGDMTKEDYAKEVAGGVIEDVPRFFGQGSKTLEAGWNTWMPTALQPFVQALENKDYAGRPIYRPKYDEAMPDSQNGRKSTQAEYKWAAEYLNSATGGNRGRSGWLDVTPETVKLISESLGKNLGRDLGNAADVGWNILSGNIGNLDSRRTPVVRDLMRTTDGNDNRYFDAVRRYDADRMELKRMRESWTPEERRAFVSDHPWVRAAAGKTPAVQRLQTEINKLRRMEGGEYRTKDGTWRKAEWTEGRVETFKKRRRELQARVLKIMGE